MYFSLVIPLGYLGEKHFSDIDFIWLELVNFMNEILDAIPSLIFVVDKDMRIFDVNKAASEYVALPPELMYQKKGGDIFCCG